MLRDNTTDFRKIFTEGIPLLDVRAQVEFQKGAFSQSVNVPILDDEQRCLVGTCYKEKGQDAAITLGHELITPSLKRERQDAWKGFGNENPMGYLYCFRGGLRSRISQQWLREAGLDYPLVVGGYKAMRTFLLEDMEDSFQNLPFVLLGGRTASGKTHLLKKIQRQVDLEGLAKHRGSSFGALVEEQPTQINFENALSIALLKLKSEAHTPVFIEDEGRRIGKRVLPQSLSIAMAAYYPSVRLEVPMEERVSSCVKDYITDLFPHFLAAHGERAHELFRQKYLDNLFKIQKRLGGDRYKLIHEQFNLALDKFEHGDETGFCEPFETLLRDYYDPMYDYQSTKRQGKLLFSGAESEVLQWCQDYIQNYVPK
jgi:tRNA 2-selenouridine synthase